MHVGKACQGGDQAADEVLASIPCYEDITSCGMTADEATLLAMLIACVHRGKRQVVQLEKGP